MGEKAHACFFSRNHSDYLRYFTVEKTSGKDYNNEEINKIFGDL